MFYWFGTLTLEGEKLKLEFLSSVDKLLLGISQNIRQGKESNPLSRGKEIDKCGAQ